MKRTILAVMVLAALAGSAQAAGTSVDVTVNGMVCSFCAQGITKKFNAEPAVEKVHVKLIGHMVYLTLKDGQDLSDDAIKKILKEAGYSVEKVERKSL